MAELSEFEVFVFSVGGQEMAFDVEHVSIVIEKTDITPVPRAKKNVPVSYTHLTLPTKA
jgi:purine-binding chemotaxis protein CheW